MRVAILNQYSSAGGGSRFARALVAALAERAPEAEFHLFADSRSVQRDGLIELLAPFPNTTIVPLDPDGHLISVEAMLAESVKAAEEPPAPVEETPTKLSALARAREWALERESIVRVYRWLKFDVLGRTPEPEPEYVEEAFPTHSLAPETVEALSAYDLVYLAWPYFLEPFDPRVPVVATFHDFNFKHGFGNFTPGMLETVERELADWIEAKPTQPISSSPFIAEELMRFYPGYRHAPEVVFLSTFAIHDPSESQVAEVRERFNLPEKYLVCPTNTSPHKNLVALFRALGEMKRSGHLIPLVLTGFGTADLNRLAEGDLELQAAYDATFALHEARLEEGLVLGEDIHALGFVSDFEMDALICGAAAVIAPSKYEAGSGPALDAWKLGTLVISSDIAPVLEQIEYLRTKAFLFDPDNPSEIARTIDAGLSDEAAVRRMVEESREGMNRYSWDQVADGYLRVFETAIGRSAAASPQVGSDMAHCAGGTESSVEGGVER
jgi:glycosyltransferase involved in cell wall biosynthesis